MRVFLLFLLTMLCMLGLLQLVRFVVRNFLTEEMPRTVLIVPLRGSVHEVRSCLKSVKRRLYWSEEEFSPLFVDCGLTCLGREEAGKILDAKGCRILNRAALAEEIECVCKTGTNVL